MSSRELLAAGFTESVAGVLQDTGIDAKTLILDVREDGIVEDPGRAWIVLAGLTALGIRIALDEFGTGNSSLGSLRSVPGEVVKIDRSLIADVSHSGAGAAFVDAVIKLAHATGFMVIAEGVENRTAARRGQGDRL